MQIKNDSTDDIKKMQQDAIRRVQEMQSRAQEKIYKTTSDVENKKIIKNKDSQSNFKPKLKLKKSFQKTNLLNIVTQDSERNLILILLIILMEEEIDSSLLLSLLYLLV